MKYISLPDDKIRRLSFYLAMEEYVARYLNEQECFFMWQVTPSVIFGRNQLIENEVNIEYCIQNGIQMYRRKSGGGCVYADMSNIMFSYISTADNIGFTFHKYLNLIVHLLRKIGVEATANLRNDVMIDGRKVSGNAFYHIRGRSIVHGTMLYDTNMKHMVGAITPNDTKLISKGIKSVRQHIALLKDYIDLDIVSFKNYVHNFMCREELTLSDTDISIIEDIEKEYLSDDFIYGNNPKYTIVFRERIDNVGEIEARIELKNNIIRSINILGDYFLVSDIDSILCQLKGKALNYDTLNEHIPDNMSDYIFNLTKKDFIQLLLK